MRRAEAVADLTARRVAPRLVGQELLATGGRPAAADRIFRAGCRLAGVAVLALLAAITVFLIVQALPALHADEGSFWTTKGWDVSGKQFGIAALAAGTVESAVIALVIAWPVAIAAALLITELAPRALARALGYVLDMLAAIPSVVYGLWGIFWLVPRMATPQQWLDRYLGWISIFSTRYGATGTPIPTKSMFVTGLVLAIMIVPIIAAVTREVFVRTDPAHKEAALALGATRWEMLRLAVLPPSRSGIVAATVLGLGRALGETIAVALVLGTSYDFQLHILEPGGNTIAANIANQYGEASPIGRSALIASGLVLFAITLVVNFAARALVARSDRRCAA